MERMQIPSRPRAGEALRGNRPPSDVLEVEAWLRVAPWCVSTSHPLFRVLIMAELGTSSAMGRLQLDARRI